MNGKYHTVMGISDSEVSKLLAVHSVQDEGLPPLCRRQALVFQFIYLAICAVDHVVGVDKLECGCTATSIHNYIVIQTFIS